MPTKSEMLAFFRKFRADAEETMEGDDESNVDEETKRIANESATAIAIASGALTRAEQSNNIVVHPPERPPEQGMSVRSKLAQIQASPKNKSPIIDAPQPSQLLLPPQKGNQVTLVLDVDETLVHSSFKPPKTYDLSLPIAVNGQNGTVFVRFRPYLSEFLNFVSSRFEVVIFTASLGLYCTPLMDFLDPAGKLGKVRLFREHCSRTNGAYIKDLALLGRPLDRVAIVDNSPVAYYFQPRNAIPILSWFDDPTDRELLELLPLLGSLATCTSVYDILDPYNAKLMP